MRKTEKDKQEIYDRKETPQKGGTRKDERDKTSQKA